MKAKIFISYRRNDSRWQSKAVFDELTKYFGKDAVFKDLEILPGENFENRLKSELEEANIVLLLISNNWLKEIKKRLANREKDYVLFEISTALSLGKYIIPLLFDDVKMPGEKELPDLIAPISKFNGIVFSEAFFVSGSNKLRDSIEDFLKKSSSPKRVLALDSGGVRVGAVLGILNYIESFGRKLFGNNTFRLQDSFDLICACGESAFNATLLAQGYPIEEVFHKYRQLAEVFNRARRGQVGQFLNGMKGIYDDKPIMNFLKECLGENELSTMKRSIDLWVLLYDMEQRRPLKISTIPALNENFDSELNYTNKLVRASLAAPSHLSPLQTLSGTYIDGSVYCGHNPSLALFNTIQSSNDQKEWKVGTENLLICSIGTGDPPRITLSKTDAANLSLLQWATNLPDILLESIDRNNDLILQANSLRVKIKEEAGLENNIDFMINHEPKFIYSRFNVLPVSKVTPQILEYGSASADAWFAIGVEQAAERLGLDFFKSWFMPR